MDLEKIYHQIVAQSSTLEQQDIPISNIADTYNFEISNDITTDNNNITTLYYAKLTTDKYTLSISIEDYNNNNGLCHNIITLTKGGQLIDSHSYCIKVFSE